MNFPESGFPEHGRQGGFRAVEGAVQAAEEPLHPRRDIKDALVGPLQNVAIVVSFETDLGGNAVEAFWALLGACQLQVAGSIAAAGLEESLWLCPIEDRRRLDSRREGKMEGFSLGSYLLLVDYTGRLFREGKTAISAELAGILDWLGSNAESWRGRLEKLRTGRLFGRFFAASQEKLWEVAERLNVRRIANLA